MIPTETPEWMSFGACRGRDPELWFPDKGGVNQNGNEAKAICDACPVREECLENALEKNEKFGIWGGKGPKERSHILRERRGGHYAWLCKEHPECIEARREAQRKNSRERKRRLRESPEVREREAEASRRYRAKFKAV